MAVESKRDGKWLEAQYSVLGSILICPELTPQVMRETTEQDFNGPCLTVYRAFQDAFLKGLDIDPVVIADKLDPSYRSFVMELMEITPTAANLDRYIELCKEQAKIVSLRNLALEMSAAEDGDSLRQIVERANGLMARRPGLKIVNMADAFKTFMDRQQQRPNYLPWPIKELNRQIYSEPGDFIIIGGYPSAGKTAWALQCAWFWAKSRKVGFFSLETSSEKLFDRQMSSIARLSMSDVKNRTIDQEGWDRICSMTNAITSRNLELVQAAGMSPADVRAVTLMQGYEIIFVDYLQLLQGSGENRTAEVSGISMALHTMAQSLGVTVVALSQLSRPQKGVRHVSPRLSDLRESGQLEQDADVVQLLSLKDQDEPEGYRILSIEKNKEGVLCDILLDFDGEQQTFRKATDLEIMVDEADKIKGTIKPGKSGKPKEKKTDPGPMAGQMDVLADNVSVPFEN